MLKLQDRFKVEEKLLSLGRTLFREIEPRDSMYKVSSFLISQLREKPFERGDIWLTDAILVLLLTWHSAFYRYGTPENFHENLKKFIEENSELLSNSDEISKEYAKQLFDELLKILAITTKKKQKRKSGVAVVKVLHLLNPKTFPLWDNYIAEAYLGSVDLKKFDNYWQFKKIVDMQYSWFQRKFGEKMDISRFYKILDELNYVFFTQRSLNAESCERLVRLLKKYSPELKEAKDELEELLEESGISDNIYLEVLELGVCD